MRSATHISFPKMLKLADRKTNHKGCLLSALKGIELANRKLVCGRDRGVGERTILSGGIAGVLVHNLPESGRLRHDASEAGAERRRAARPGLNGRAGSRESYPSGAGGSLPEARDAGDCGSCRMRTGHERC